MSAPRLPAACRLAFVKRISREQCPEHERHGGTPGRIALGAAEQQAEGHDEPGQRDESQEGYGPCGIGPGGLGRIAEEGHYLLTCCVELGLSQVVIAMIGTKSKTMPASPAAPVTRPGWPKDLSATWASVWRSHLTHVSEILWL